MMEPHPHVLRRFVLLGGETYYARGGFQDFISSHDTIGEAVTKAIAMEGERPEESSIEWWHVWDCETNAVVAASKYSAHGTRDPWPKLDKEQEEK